MRREEDEPSLSVSVLRRKQAGLFARHWPVCSRSQVIRLITLTAIEEIMVDMKSIRAGGQAKFVGGGTINLPKTERREHKVKRIHDILRLHEYKPITEPSSLQAVNAAFSRSTLSQNCLRRREI